MEIVHADAEAQRFRESARVPFALEQPPEFRPGSQRIRDPRALPAGRERQVRLGLPRRCGALHLRRSVQAGHIQHVLVRHEQAAVHAADGYARATGEVGVALVTSGPGVTNAVTGIATAYMDSIPMVIITGQVPTPAIGLDAFQECDTVGITRPSSNTTSSSRTCATSPRPEEGVPHRPYRPSRPGGGRHPEGRVDAQTPFVLSRPRRHALVQPGRPRATAARSARPCSCCSRPSARTSTRAAAWCWATRRSN
jgi:hypothetical protein